MYKRLVLFTLYIVPFVSWQEHFIHYWVPDFVTQVDILDLTQRRAVQISLENIRFEEQARKEKTKM